MGIVEQLTNHHGPLRWSGTGDIQEQLDHEIAEWTETAPIEWINILIALADENPDQFRYEIIDGATSIKTDGVNFVNPILVDLVEVWSRKDPDFVVHRLGAALLKSDCISGDFLIKALWTVYGIECLPWVYTLNNQRISFSTAEVAVLADLLGGNRSPEAMALLTQIRDKTPITMTEAHQYIDKYLPKTV